MMKILKFILMVFMILLWTVDYRLLTANVQQQHASAGKEVKAVRAEKPKKIYRCSMHPQVVSDKPGKCPICGMSLVEVAEIAQEHSEEQTKPRKIIYYRNPMNPAITSPTLMKDSMGMDYIPVYEDEEDLTGEISQENIVNIKVRQQEVIGIKTETVLTRPLSRVIRTVAKIAFDPELYKTEQEFIQALKLKEELKSSGSKEIFENANSLVSAAELKLKLQGLGGEQIEELRSKTDSDRNLLISDPQAEYTWAYLTLYEYDLGEVKTGQQVILKTVAYPQEEFSGRILAIDPVLDMNTRSVRARVKVNNPGGKIKPNMYADAFIHVDLGEKLALPKEAVLDTGLRKIVYVDLGKGRFVGREVELGQEAAALVPFEKSPGGSLGLQAGGSPLDGQEVKFYPVISGLKENEVVVTNGGFLIDSQSQITGGMSVLWGSAAEIKGEDNQLGQEIKTQHKH